MSEHENPTPRDCPECERLHEDEPRSRVEGLDSIQRYSLEVDEAGQAYMELDPEGPYCFFRHLVALAQVEPDREGEPG